MDGVIEFSILITQFPNLHNLTMSLTKTTIAPDPMKAQGRVNTPLEMNILCNPKNPKYLACRLFNFKQQTSN